MSHDPSALFPEAYHYYRRKIVYKLEEILGSVLALKITSAEAGKMRVDAHAYALSSSKWYGDSRMSDAALTHTRVEFAATSIAEWGGN